MSQPLLNLYLDVDRPGGGLCLLQALGTSDLESARIPFTSLDLVDLRVYFRSFVSVAIGADWTKAAGATIDAILVAETSLVDATPAIIVHLTPLSVGGSTNHYYTGILDLSGSAVAIALDSAAEVNCVLNITVTDSLTRATYRVPCILRRSTQGTPPS